MRDAIIAGVGESRHGVVPGANAEELMVEAGLAALDDAGLSTNDVDGLFCSSSYQFLPTLALAEHLGIRPSYQDSTSLGGASFVAYLGHAALAIEAGRCDVALITYGSTQRSDGGSLVSFSGPDKRESAVGYRYPVSGYALAAARHMHEYGTTSEHLASVAVAARQWAALTPGAFAPEALTVNDVASSKMISTPLRLLDCCLVTDGGAAIVLTRRDRTSSLRTGHVEIMGYAETAEHLSIAEMLDLTSTGARMTGPAALREAGVTIEDIDVVMLYDSFTINPVLFLEDLGFCGKGDGGPFIASGATAPGGPVPVNTNGGGLAYTHPGMLGAFLIVEAVRQLRGEAGARQVTNAELGLVHGCGGVLASHVTAVLGRP